VISEGVSVSPALDACPGVLALHPARDGLVARIRLPGGYATAATWRALAALAADFGDGCVDVTARGNVQLRGLRAADAEALAERTAAAGLMPSAQHDRARNITASPLSGLGGRPPLRDLVDALDAALLAGPEFAALPGRFLFALDDGTGGASLATSDIGLSYVGAPPASGGPAQSASASGGPAPADVARRGFDLLLAGRYAGVRISDAEAVPTVLAATRAALAAGVGASVTRIAALPDGGQSVAAAVGGELGAHATPDTRLPLGPASAVPPATSPATSDPPLSLGPASAVPPATSPALSDPPVPAQPGPVSHTGPSRPPRPDPLAPSGAHRVSLHDRDRFTADSCGESVTIMEEAHGAGAGGVGGVVVAAARLGRLSGEQIRVIASLVAPGEVVRVGVAGRLVIPLAATVTPDATVAPGNGVAPDATVVPDDGVAYDDAVDEGSGSAADGHSAGQAAAGLFVGEAIAQLAAAGLVVAADDPMGDVTACSGAACNRSLADVRAAAGPVSNYRKTHWAGCSRMCGCPPDAEPVVALGATRYRMPGEGGA
jgi:Nitrite/Sulfite reductase ferredoxin-like half domain